MTDSDSVFGHNKLRHHTSRLSPLFNCAWGAGGDVTGHSVLWEDNQTHGGTPQVPNSMGSDVKAAGN